MKFHTLAAATTFVSFATSSPSENNALSHVDKRASNVAITGVPGTTQPRLEIRQLASEQPEQWSLFLLALQQWQAVDTNVTTGYYQVSGIHGVPRVSWDGVEPCDGCDNVDGYCTHDSVLFPAWHRAYLALYEQELIAVAQEIAATYPDSSRASMQAAATALRLPFWDWAAQPGSGPVLPTLISGTQISVDGPNGQQTIANPLYSFKLSDPSNLVYSPFITWENTLRYPDSNNATATSQEDETTNAFDNIQSSLQDQVYQLMSTCNEYLQFSNDDSGSSSSSCSNSLEAIHNTVHGIAGGPGSSSVSAGHMTYLSLAAFDPIFWVHHANVDRLFALWQTTHPSSYGASQTAPHTTWSIEQGSSQGADSPLAPFHKDTAGNFWTTNEVQDWDATFHYTYPEYVSTDGSEGAIASLINELYGPSATLTAGEVPASTKAQQVSTSSKSHSSTSSSSSAPVSSSSAPVSSSSAPVSSSSVPVSSSSVPVSSSSASKSPTTNTALSSSTPTASSSASKSSTTNTALSSSTSTASSSVEVNAISASASSTAVTSNSDISLLAEPSNDASTTTATRNVSSTAVFSVFESSKAVPKLPTFTAPRANWTLSIPDVTPNNGSQYQYVANCQSERYALNGSYYILLFDGQPTGEPSSWFGSKDLIGLLAIVAGGDMKVNLVSTGSIPLTRTLQKLVSQGVISDMSQDSCLPYLKEHLVWRILGPDGRSIIPSDVPSFEVSVFSSTSTIPGQFSLPQWSEFIPQVQVTSHKAGGVNSSDVGVSSGIGGGISAAGYGSSGKKTVTLTKTSTSTYCPCEATATV